VDCPRLDALPARQLDSDLRIAEASTRKARMRGLARLDAMPPSYGLHIPRCRSIQTLTMRFPLDLIWLGPDGRPVRIDRDVAPRRLKSCLKARSVIEVNAGQADRFVSAGL
jgi:uncharacterized membrane protein (UPF0127 family)